jgi:hypothetical protein
MHRLVRVVAVGLAVIVATVALPGPAGAHHSTDPYNGVRLTWTNGQTGLCLGVAGGDVTNGKAIILWACNGNSDQTWTAESVNPDGHGPYLFKNGTNPNKCLSVANKSLSQFAALVIWDCKPSNDNQDQRWYIVGWPRSPFTGIQNDNSDLFATASWHLGYQIYTVVQRSIPQNAAGLSYWNNSPAPW